MRSIKGSLVGLVLAGSLALAPTAAFARGGAGSGHGGGHFIGQNYVNLYRNAYVPNTPLATVHQFARREYL